MYVCGKLLSVVAASQPAASMHGMHREAWLRGEGFANVLEALLRGTPLLVGRSNREEEHHLAARGDRCEGVRSGCPLSRSLEFILIIHFPIRLTHAG